MIQIINLPSRDLAGARRKPTLWRMKMRTRVRLVLLAATVVLQACTYAGSNDNPILRKFTWFSYVGGDDIRRDCRPGQFDKHRLIYNATWDEQVRAYDLVQSASGEGALLFQTVFKGGSLGIVELLNPYAGPWGGVHTDRKIDEAQYRALRLAIERSGLGQPSPAGLRLHSQSFYWVALGCVGGQFFFNAWDAPDRIKAVVFDRPLFALDNTGVPVNPVHPYDWSARMDIETYRGTDTNFELMVGSNGLRF